MPDLYTDIPVSLQGNHRESLSTYQLVKPRQSVISEPPPRDVQIAILAEAGGGVMRHVIDLHQGLVQRGWRSTLILSPRRMDERYLAEVHSLGREQVVLIDMERALHPSDLNVYLQVRSALSKMRGRRVLHAHSTKAGLLGTLMYPEVDAMAYTPHAYRATDPSLSPVKRRALRGVEMAYSRSYDRIIAVSQSEREYVLDCGVDPARVTCIPNGIAGSGIDAASLRRRRSRQLDKITLGFVGRLVHQKNPLLFVETLAHLVQSGYDMNAIVVGDGELKDDMMYRAEELNVAERIDWRGEVSASETLNEMDIMLHTSRYEALPYTLLEACASLLPVVATDNHGSRSVFQDELAENIVTEAKPQELSDRVLQLIHDKALWGRQLDLLERAAYEFSLEAMVTKVEQVYLDLFSNRFAFSRGMQKYMTPAISRIQFA